jgi:endonuclease YncB( thermonuclease family)
MTGGARIRSVEAFSSRLSERGPEKVRPETVARGDRKIKGMGRVKLSLAAALLFGFIGAVQAEELRHVDPKTVIDGDTFYVSVRLLGVDAPERGDRAKCDQERALSKRSTERVKELLHGRVTLDVRGVDEFGRLLANIRLSDGRDLGEVLLRENLARPYKAGQHPNWC